MVRVRRRGAFLTVAFALLCTALVIGLHFRSITVRTQPLSALMQVLKAHGYKANHGLAGSFVPGTLVQIAERDASGARRELLEPLVFMWGSDCFPEKAPEEHLYALPDSSGSTLDRLTVDGPSVDHDAPVFALQDRAVAHYRLRFGQPRVRTFAKGDMSLQFSQACVAALNRAVSRGDEASFYDVVIETLVADFVEYEIEWTRSTDAQSHLTLKSAIQERLRQSTGRTINTQVSVQTLSEGKDHSLLHASGEVILAYRLRPVELTTTTPLGSGENP
jgi:hypothetical protein